MSTGASLPKTDVLHRLDGVRNRFVTLILLRGAGRFLAWMLTFAAVLAGLDLLFRWTVDARIFLFGLFLVTGGILFVRGGVRPVLAMRRIDRRAVAEAVEEAHPPLRGWILPLLDGESPGVPEVESESLWRAHRTEGALRLREADLSGLFRSVPAVAGLARAGGVLALLVLFASGGGAFGRGLARVFPWVDAPWTFLRLETETVRVPRGGDLVVAAVAEGYLPDHAAFTWRTDDGVERSLHVNRSAGGRYAHAFRSLRESCTYRFAAGDGRTAEGRIEVMTRPMIDRFVMTVRPPEYTRLGPVAYDTGDAQILAGSEVEIRIDSNKPLADARIAFDHGDVYVMEVDGDRARTSFTLARGGTYTVGIRDRGGLEPEMPLRYALQAVDDRPPRVRVDSPATAELKVVPAAVIPFLAEVVDDYGIRAVRLVLEDPVTKGRTGIELAPATGAYAHDRRQTRIEVGWLVSSRQLTLQPGTERRVFLEADDFRPGVDRTGTGPSLRLLVVEPGDLLRDLDDRLVQVRNRIEEGMGRQQASREAVVRSLREGIDSLRAAEAAEGQKVARNLIGDALGKFDRILELIEWNRMEREFEMSVFREIREILDGASGDMGSLVAATDALRTSGGGGLSLDEIAARQSFQVDRLLSVLDRLQQWETYAELLRVLHDIRDSQRDVNEEMWAEIKSWLETATVDEILDKLADPENRFDDLMTAMTLELVIRGDAAIEALQRRTAESPALLHFPPPSPPVRGRIVGRDRTHYFVRLVDDPDRVIRIPVRDVRTIDLRPEEGNGR